MQRVTRKRLGHAAYPILLRWCGVAGVLGGLLFGAWSYIDRPDIPETLITVVHFLPIVVPGLFLAAVIGVCVLWRSWLGVLGWIGVALAAYGSGGGVIEAFVGGDSVWAYFAQRVWAPHLHAWLSIMLSGLALIGVATVREKPFGGMSTLALGMGVFGWVYFLTDTGAVLEARLAHIGFGLLIILGWVALGSALLAAGTRRVQRSQSGS